MEIRMNTALEKLLISELRIVVYEAADAGSKPAKADSFVPQLLSDDRITQAMTVNEELRNLGYTLKPADILRLAASRSPLDDRIRAALPESHAERRCSAHVS